MLERLRADLAWFDARGTGGMDPRTAQVFSAARAFVARSIEAHCGERPPPPARSRAQGAARPTYPQPEADQLPDDQLPDDQLPADQLPGDQR